MVLDELIGVLGWDLRGEEDLRRFQNGMKRAEAGLDAFAKRAGAFAMAIGAATAAGMAALGKSVISVSAEFESMQATLETIEGSADKAKQSLDWVAKFAKETPFDVQQVSEAFVRMRSYGLDPMDGSLRALGDASSAMGKSLMQAVEMVADASTGEFERLKEFGLRASQAGDMVTFKWTKNGQELTKTVKKNSGEIARFITEHFGERFNGAMLRQSKTWNGMMSNLGDSWQDFQRRIGRGGFFDTAKRHLGDLLDYIGELDQDGTLDRWSKALGNGLTWAVGQAKGTIDDFKFVFDSLSGWVKEHSGWWKPIMGGLVTLGAVILPKTFALLVLQDILKWLQGKGSVIGDFAAKLEELTGIDASSIDNVLAALAVGGAGLMIAVGPVRMLGGAIRGLAAALGMMAGANVAKGTAALATAGEAAAGKTGTGKGAMSRPGFSFANLLGIYNAWALVDAIPDTKEGVEEMFNRNKERTDGWSKALNDSPWLPRNWFKGGKNTGHPYTQPIVDDGGRAASQDAWLNFQGNLAKTNPSNAAKAVEQTVNDSRNQSVTVEVGGVTVNGVPNASAAVGGAVGRAVGGAAARNAGGTRFEKDDAI